MYKTVGVDQILVSVICDYLYQIIKTNIETRLDPFPQLEWWLKTDIVDRKE